MKKILSMAVAVFVLVTPFFSYAAESAPSGDLAYFIAASRYLNVHADQNFYLNKAIDGLKARTSTRKEFHKLIAGARHQSDQEWDAYSQSGKLVVPVAFTAIHNNIQRSRELRETAFKEWLTHWERSNPAKKINKDYEASQHISREALNDLSDAMKAAHLKRQSNN
ncbi:MAG TPA: hypothetical protein VJM76_02265 [Gammaproteobacteria bacterium]|nr:hypothetical protein [Gammaproteobacteria bacterium]